MSTQYTDHFYCETNQTTSYWQIPIELLAKTNANELITKDVYDQMFASLKAIHDFGESDKKTRLPNVDDKINFIPNESYITTDFYNDIARRIKESQKDQNQIIQGTYFSDLFDAIKNYELPSTRYYTTTSQCCDYCDDCHTCSYRTGSSCTKCIATFDTPHVGSCAQAGCHNYDR